MESAKHRGAIRAWLSHELEPWRDLMRPRTWLELWQDIRPPRLSREAEWLLDRPDPETLEQAEQYWKRQSELPLSQRSLGWWIEVGLVNIAAVLFMVFLVLTVISWL